MKVNAVYSCPPDFKIKRHVDAYYFLDTAVETLGNMDIEHDGDSYDLWKDKSGWHLTKRVFSNGVVGISTEVCCNRPTLMRFVYKNRKQINREFFNGK